MGPSPLLPDPQGPVPGRRSVNICGINRVGFLIFCLSQLSLLLLKVCFDELEGEDKVVSAGKISFLFMSVILKPIMGGNEKQSSPKNELKPFLPTSS